VYGDDSESWGGNYGPMVDYVSLVATKADLTSSEQLLNHDFNTVANSAPSNWTISSGTWDACQGLYYSSLCVGFANTPFHENYTTSILDVCVANIADANVTKQTILTVTGFANEAALLAAVANNTWGIYNASGSGSFGTSNQSRPDIYCGNSQDNTLQYLDSNASSKDYFWGGGGNDTVAHMWLSVFYGGDGDDTASILDEASLFYGEAGNDACPDVWSGSVCTP
jgi:hypothetical protein